MNRSGMSRLETRSTRANKEDLIKRVMLTVERVRKWEKKWVNAETDGCTLKIYKWVPVVNNDLKQVKTIQNDSLSEGISNMSSNTSSPLVIDEGNLNSVSIPGKPNEGMSAEQQTLLTNNSEPSRHANMHLKTNDPGLKLGCERLFCNEGKVMQHTHGSKGTHLDVGKVLQDRDDGEDSNHATSIASEDSTSLMYHLGMNVGGENDDSRHSFHSATDSENSGDYNRKSPTSSSASQINIHSESSGSFSITASTFNSSLQSTSKNIMNEEPARKRPRQDPIQE